VVALRVAEARARSVARGYAANSEVPARLLNDVAPLSPRARSLLERRMERGDLSARVLSRVRRVALTLDDLASHEGPVTPESAAMALEMRAGRQVLGGDGRWAA